MISVHPKDSMFYDRVEIRADGLKPNKIYIVRNKFSERSGRFESWAAFKANGNGIIGCGESSAIDGTYTGVDQMGLFWSMDQSPGQRPGTRFMKKAVTAPLTYNVHAFPLTIENAETGQVLASQQFRKFFLHPDYERYEVKVGRNRGALFCPKDPSIRCPGVIDLFGTGGGSIEHRASLLASKGFTVLSLAYFRYDDLPTDLKDGISLEYFEGATEWFSKHPQVNPGGIAAIGVSSGADLVVMMGTLFKQVKATVAINGFFGNYSKPAFHYRNKPMYPGEPIDFQKIVMLHTESIRNGTKSKDAPFAFTDHTPNMKLSFLDLFAAETAVEPIRFLLVAGEDDRNVDAKYSHMLHDRLKHFGKGHLAEVVEYPGAGHLIEPPWQPCKPVSYHKFFDSLCAWGGHGPDHSRAQELFWHKMIQFVSENIGPPSKRIQQPPEFAAAASGDRPAQSKL